MPQVGQAVRLTFKGLIASVQTWSTSIWWGVDGGGVTTPSAAQVVAGMTLSTDLETAIDSLWASLSLYMSSNTVMNNWEITAYGSDPTSPVTGAAVAPGATAGSSSHNLPPECALVASLRSATFGKSGRGRMYLPLDGLLIGNDGLASTVACTDTSAAVANFIATVNGHNFAPAVGPNFTVKGVVNSVVNSELSRITNVGVDSRVDSQRRREHKLPGLVHSSLVV